MYVSSSKYLGKHDQQINACTTLWFWKICNNENIQIKNLSTINSFIISNCKNHEEYRNKNLKKRKQTLKKANDNKSY